jgi:transglutaminase-like putative cysteine protease
MNWLKLLNKTIFCMGLYCFCLFSTNAQNTLQEYKNIYPNYNELVVNDVQNYNITIEDKKLKIIQDNHYESIILTENGIQNNKESFSYSELIKLKSYDAYSIINENGKERKIKVTQTTEKQAQESSVFYNDVKERVLTFPNLEAGSKKVYDYQTEFMDPYLLHKFIFGNNIPIQNSSLEIKTDKEITIGYKIFNDPNNNIIFSKTEKKGKWIYKWTLKNITPLKFEDNSPGFLYIVPHINIYIKDYTVDNKVIEVLGNENKLFEYYKGFVKNLNQKENVDLKALSLDLTKNQINDAEKIKSIFYWVKNNIKYIAFENGYEGFIPREANFVFERKFGDCKDMTSIISSMAKYANIKNVNLAWIGTRTIPYSYAEIPTPSVDNHMIAVFKDGEDYLFLDATDKETRYGIPTAFIQGKEAMLNENGSYKIISVPVVAAEKNEIKEVVKLAIEKNKLVGSGKLELQGYNRSHTLSRIGDASNKTRFEMIKEIVLKGNNKFNLKEYSEENKEERDKPYVINFNFDLDNYIVKVDKEIYINLFLDKIYDKMIIEKGRISKYEFEFLTYFNTRYELEIPQNCSIKYLPKNFTLDNELLKADFIYEIKNNTLLLNIQLKQKKILLENTDFQLWNETIKKLKNNYTETLILLEK